LRKNEKRTWFFNELSGSESQFGSTWRMKIQQKQASQNKKEAKTKRGSSLVWSPILLLDKSVSVDTN
jgi:hypothetical protein